MFKKVALLTVVAVAVVMVAGLAMAQKDNMAPMNMEVAAPAAPAAAPAAAPVVVGNKVCPVTGMTIADADLGKNTVEYEGKVYNLCTAGCKDEFVKDPKKYVAKVEEEMAKVKEEAPATMK